MKDLQVTLELESETWFIENLQDFNPSTEVLFNVKQISPETLYDNLRFGFDLVLNGDIIQSVIEPPEATTYISSDQSYLKSIPINVIYNREYNINLWVENGGKRYERSYNFTTPKPEQPYPSWTWIEEGETWQSPIPRPDDGNLLVWSEELQEWGPALNTAITLPQHGVWNDITKQWEDLPDYELT